MCEIEVELAATTTFYCVVVQLVEALRYKPEGQELILDGIIAIFQ
jgi:hypothetical protein